MGNNNIKIDVLKSHLLESMNLSRIVKIDYNTKDLIWHLGDENFMTQVFFNNTRLNTLKWQRFDWTIMYRWNWTIHVFYKLIIALY